MLFRDKKKVALYCEKRREYKNISADRMQNFSISTRSSGYRRVLDW
jgi:hypothetical protein